MEKKETEVKIVLPDVQVLGQGLLQFKVIDGDGRHWCIHWSKIEFILEDIDGKTTIAVGSNIWTREVDASFRETIVAYQTAKRMDLVEETAWKEYVKKNPQLFPAGMTDDKKEKQSKEGGKELLDKSKPEASDE